MTYFLWRLVATLFCVILSVSISLSADAPAKLQLQKADRIAIIGNTLADRMQHFGWLETLMHSRFPEHELVFRNLGFSGDELTLRLRSEAFGSPDHWLGFVKADVIFAFFGYNESFAGAAGLEKFKKDLDEFIKHTLKQTFNGKNSPRLVLFSPIAHENLRDPNFPDGSANNTNLQMYTEAMAGVAKVNKIVFVDLFRASQKLYASADKPLTINGVHLNENGDRQIAHVIINSLFAGQPRRLRIEKAVPGVPGYSERVRAAVLDKNRHWFERYRTVDGYSVYGGRSHLKFVDGQTNRDVMQREMEILDVMTANRDKRIWAVAQGKDLKVDDSNTPPFIPVKTNIPGKLQGAKHPFLGGEEAMAKMTVAKGMKVNLFASEEMYSQLANPVQMTWDTKGRLWVAVWPSYPHWKPKDPFTDKILILEDTNGDGKADVCKTFADELHCPTGFEFYNGGILLAQAPDLMFLKDTNGDDKADVRERVLHGLDSADTHHTANSFVLGPGGDLFFQEGTFHHTQVETPYGPPERCANAGVFRYEPRTHKFEVYVSYSFANPHGHVFDRWGQDFVTDGTGNVNYFAAGFSGRIDFPRKHPHMEAYFKQRIRPCAGTEILSSRHFPDEMQGNLLDANVIGFQGILQYKYADKDSGFTATEVEPVVFSADPNFRPADAEVGPDGALYFLDWHNPIIGHMQHNLRDPNRDVTHGRIYRVTYPSRPLLKPAKIAGEPIPKLLDLLEEPEDRVRYRAKIELGAHKSDEVISALTKWIEQLDKNDPNYEHQMMEALWLHQYHNVINEPLLRRMLRSPEFRARAAATRVLCYWRDRIPEALELFKLQANDESPRVRLETVRACSFFRDHRAADVALLALKRPMDYYLKYTLGETMKQLEPYWKQAIRDGKSIAADNPAGVDYLLQNISPAELARLPRTAVTYQALLSREGVLHDYRHEALKGLAELRKTDEAAELLAAIERNDQSTSGQALNVLHDLAHILVHHGKCELADHRAKLEQLAAQGRRPFTRQIAYVGLMLADNSVEKAWAAASKASASLQDCIDAIPALPDAKLRAALYEKVKPIVKGLPGNSAGANGSLRRAAIHAITFIEGHEPETFTTLAQFIKEGQEREASVRALRRIPKPQWPAAEVRPLLEAILAHVSKLSTKQRTQPEVLDELQLGNDLSSLLPQKEAKDARARLGELGVNVVSIRTVPHQMVYDRTKFYAQAGKPVVIVLENADIMPHNLLITKPGMMIDVATAAEQMASQPDAFAKSFIPSSSKVLHAMRMVQPQETARLQFIAPKVPGDYPYVCTFPGHWRLMYGTMHVVPKLSDLPPEELQPPPAAELKARPFVRNWTVDDLEPFLSQLDNGRSFENGKKLFTAASCVQCHAVGKEGPVVGPNIAELPKKLAEKKFTRKDVLREIIHPSEVINQDFKNYLIETTQGEVVTGVIVGKDNKAIRIVTNPLIKPREIPVKDIEEQREAKVSLMPEGLLTTLSKEEILDLIAYIISGGDLSHAAFRK